MKEEETTVYFDQKTGKSSVGRQTFGANEMTPERSEPKKTAEEVAFRDSLAEAMHQEQFQRTSVYPNEYKTAWAANASNRRSWTESAEGVMAILQPALTAYASQVAEERVKEEKKRADDNFKSYERIKDLYSKSTSEGFTQGFNAARDKAAGKCLYHIVYSAETTNLLGNLEGEIRAMTPDGEGK